MNNFQYLVLNFGDEGRPSKTPGLLCDNVLLSELSLRFVPN